MRDDEVRNPDIAQPKETEFDLLAEEYYDQHATNIAITGETPEYFAEYKIADLARFAKHSGQQVERILDFGSGTGNSLPYFRKYFCGAVVTCSDVSTRSMEISQTRFPGPEKYLQIGREIPLATHSQDVVFSACVFHHIPHDQHIHWLKELSRVTRPGGILAVYEHNPFNPLTVRAVNTCPLDVNAKLVHGGVLQRLARKSGWRDAHIQFKLFFPATLKVLRHLDQYLHWLPLGAQYRLGARNRQ